MTDAVHTLVLAEIIGDSADNVPVTGGRGHALADEGDGANFFKLLTIALGEAYPVQVYTLW